MDHVPLEHALDQLSDHLRARADRCARTGVPIDSSAAALLRLANVAATTTSRAAEEDLSLHLSRERLLDAAALLQEHAAA